MRKWLSLVGVVAYPVSACRLCAAEIGESAADLNELTQKILDSVSPQSWHKGDGEGTITPILIGPERALVVRQKAPVHEEIRRWLATHGPK